MIWIYGYSLLSAVAIAITVRWGLNNRRRRMDQEREQALRDMTGGRLRANLEACARAQLAELKRKADGEPWGDVPKLPEDRDDA